MTSWVIQALDEGDRLAASRAVGESLLANLGRAAPEPPASFATTSRAYEFAVSASFDQKDASADLREAAELAFETARAVPAPADGEARALHFLHTACYGVLADRTPDVSRYLRESPLHDRPLDDVGWGRKVRGSVYRLWLLLLRKDGWDDLDAVQQEVVALRESQAVAEAAYLKESSSPRGSAWELVASYHLAKAAEILATYSAQGSVGGGFNVREQLQAQFDRSTTACERAELIDLHATVRLLAFTAEKMVANSIWSVTRAVNSRVSKFVAHLVDRGQQHPIFEMLPPQRITLRENGLLGSGHRAVVVSLPTSSGKTFIAQFRILQALNQFDTDRGWVAYIAPTRALVNQICAKLRRDFTPLGIVVERVSPALDIDGVEAEFLAETDNKAAFRVLVGTPEKIDLLLRGGWEVKIVRTKQIGEPNDDIPLLLGVVGRACWPYIRCSRTGARDITPDEFKEARHKLGLEQYEMARILRVSPRHIRRYEASLGASTRRDVPYVTGLLVECMNTDSKKAQK